MGLTQRLIKHRYGIMNIKAPTKDDLDDYGLRTTRLRKPVPHLFDQVIYQLRNPPLRDRYYKHYIITVEKYCDDLYNATKQSRWQSQSQLIDIHFAGKLLYMNQHPNRFHGFHNFKYTWLYNALCAMRTYSIGQAYRRGNQGNNNSTASWSAGFQPWPKPLTTRATDMLADKLYDIIYPRTEYIHKRSL